MSSKPNSDNPNYNTSRHKDKMVEPVKATPKVLSLAETLSATTKVVKDTENKKRNRTSDKKSNKKNKKIDDLTTSDHPENGYEMEII